MRAEGEREVQGVELAETKPLASEEAASAKLDVDNSRPGSELRLPPTTLRLSMAAEPPATDPPAAAAAAAVQLSSLTSPALYDDIRRAMTLGGKISGADVGNGILCDDDDALCAARRAESQICFSRGHDVPSSYE